MRRRAIPILCLFLVAAPSLAQEAPRFDIEKGCKALPLESARNWCVQEERCNQKWFEQNWGGVTAGVSRDAAAACTAIARAAGPYRYWTLRRCIAPGPATGAACN